MSRAAMQQALEALRELSFTDSKITSAKEALAVALAEPEQEPVAWAFRYSDGTYHDPSVTKHSAGMVPLYPCTAPTPRKPVELTDEEIVQVLGSVRESITGSVFLAFARAVIAAYEDKNGIAGEQT